MMKNRIQIPEDLLDIAPGYLANRIRDLTGLKDALIRRDLDFIAKLAHKTKGTAGGYGFTELTPLSKTLELAAKSGNLTEVESALEAVQKYLETVEIANSA